MKKVKAAVVGVGSWGKNHARVYSELEDVELVAVADASEDRAREIAIKHGAKSYTDLTDMLKKEEIDVLSICTPTTYHFENAMTAMEQGISVLVEKPVCNTVEEAKRLLAYSRKNNVMAMVGFIERFNPITRKIKEIIASDELGHLVLITVRRLGPFWPQRVKDVSVMKDVSIHDLDGFYYMLEKDPIELYAVGGKLRHDYEDYVEILLKYEHVAGFIESNYLTPKKIRTIQATFEHGLLEGYFLEQKLKLTTDKGEKDISPEWIEPLKSEIASFVHAWKTNSDPPVSLEDGVKALYLVESVIKSINEDTIVKLNPSNFKF